MWVIVSRFIARPALTIAAIVGATTLLIQTAPGAFDKVFWRVPEYRKLRQLHAGFSLSYIKSKLGEPALVRNIAKEPALDQYLFIKRDYVVELIVNSSGEAVVYSVLSCDGRFRPKFDTPSGTVLTLQGGPLSRTEQPVDKHPAASEVTALNDQRTLVYHPGATGSSIGLLVEEGAPPSTATLGRGYYLGVNEICFDFGKLPDASKLSYSGSLEAATPEVKSARAMVAANFYAETAHEDFYLTPDAVLDTFDLEKKHISVFVSPYQFDVPLSIFDPADTRVFRD